MNQNHPTNSNEEDEQVEKLIQTLPRVSLRGSSFKMIEYEGFYYYNEDDIPTLTNAINFQKHFVARDTDIFIISPAKTGTSWLKKLLFCVVNRVNYPTIDQIPLHSHTHYQQHQQRTTTCIGSSFTQLDSLPSPRLLNIAISYW